ncbi:MULTISPECIES: SA1362 family protein [Sediminibacillus]|uniref:SA1362 family protein n=1 Tax=Sediminibacillus TaxID=482460 RepID=UPI0003F5A704|nr:SA1362 family protein [Sediminibacillus terrae]
MTRSKMSLFIYLLIGLAIFGFAAQLLTNTSGLLMNLVMMVVVGAALYGVVYYFFIRKRTSNELKKYKKAVKQSKMKYKGEDAGSKKTFSQAAKKNAPLLKQKKNNRARATHLRVIDGNKHKRKNRASL